MSLNLYGQSSKSQISVHGGPSLFSFWSTPKENIFFDYGFSYSTGIGYSRRISHLSTIDIRLLYSNNNLIRDRSTLLFNCVDIPIDYRVYMGARKRIYWSLGAFASIITSSTVKSYSSSGELYDTYSNYNSFNSVNFGFSGSFGIEFPITNKFQIRVESFNIIGLTPITKDYNIPGHLYFNLKKYSLNLLVGLSYQIPNNKKS